jgi:hypothetical protein
MSPDKPKYRNLVFQGNKISGKKDEIELIKDLNLYKT